MNWKKPLNWVVKKCWTRSINNIENYLSKIYQNHPSITNLIKSQIAEFMEHQPLGYRDFGLYLVPEDFKVGQDKIIDNVRNACYLNFFRKKPPSQIPGRQFFLDKIIPPCPVYIVQDKSYKVLKVVKPFPAKHGVRVVVHTREHPPAHIHLECPIGNEKGRYEWPSLDPLKGEGKLSNRERNKLELYLSEYGEEINQKIESVFGGFK